ncbi:MAG: terminase family protein [Cystobacter sp.]
MTTHAEPQLTPSSLYPGQRPPPGSWRTWLCIGGWGAGKTHAVSMAVIAEAMADPEAHILMVGSSSTDVLQRQIGIDARDSRSSSILALAPPAFRPTVRLARRALTFPNGARVQWASAWNPDGLRGFSCSLVCARDLSHWGRDALAALEECRRAARHQTSRMCQLGLPARLFLTSRAAPTALLHNAVEASDALVRTRLSTLDNSHHLEPRLVEQARKLRHTVAGRRDFEGELYFSPEEYEENAPPLAV